MSSVVLAQTFYNRWRVFSSEPTVWKLLVFNKSNPFCSDRCWILCRRTYNANFTYVHTPLWRVRSLSWHELMFTRLLHGSSSEWKEEILWLIWQCDAACTLQHRLSVWGVYCLLPLNVGFVGFDRTWRIDVYSKCDFLCLCCPDHVAVCHGLAPRRNVCLTNKFYKLEWTDALRYIGL